MRNRVRVPGLAAVSQAIGCRKAPAYRPMPLKGGDAKPVCLSLGPSPRLYSTFVSKGEICISEIFEHKRARRPRVVCSRKSSEHMSTQYAPPFICVESRRRCVSGPRRNAGQYVQSASTAGWPGRWLRFGICWAYASGS